MNSISIYTMIFTTLITINALLRNVIEDKVNYDGVDLSFYGWKHIMLFMFFGFLFLLFPKKVKRYRKKYFIKNTIKNTKWYLKAFPDNDYYTNKLKEYNKYMRIEKIEKINRKIKWNKIFNLLN